MNTKYTIGFADMYYTLWKVERVHNGENVQYIQNLSMDFAKAQNRLIEITGCMDYDYDPDLRGEQGLSFFRPLAPCKYEPYLLSISRFAGTDMREIIPNEEYQSGRDHDNLPIYKKMSGLLWATYLNTDEKTFRGLRRRVIARECLIKAGLLIKQIGSYITPMQLKRSSAITGHHFQDGARTELKVSRIGKVNSFIGHYGTTYLITLIDENNRLYKYKGSCCLDISEDEYILIKGTINHGSYKNEPETQLKRIKIL